MFRRLYRNINTGSSIGCLNEYIRAINILYNKNNFIFIRLNTINKNGAFINFKIEQVEKKIFFLALELY